MSSRTLTQTLRRRQLDRLFAGNPSFRHLARSRRGWVHEIRNALGMSAEQLASRLGVRQSSVARMERAEQEEVISLQTLRQSLEVTLEQQARKRAEQMTRRIEHTMALEAPSQREEAVADEIQDLAAELIHTLSRELWREEKT